MSKFQASMTNEIPMSNVQNLNRGLEQRVENQTSNALDFGIWELVIHWKLGFGPWTFGVPHEHSHTVD